MSDSSSLKTRSLPENVPRPRSEIAIQTGGEENQHRTSSKYTSNSNEPTKNVGSLIEVQDQEGPIILHVDWEERAAPILSLLIFFSIVGVLIRIGLTDLNSYQGAPVFSLIYAQFIGCAIMGFCLASKDMIMAL